MNRLKSNRLASQSGTTLIELSVVIAVILLLATVLFMGVQGWRDAANRSAAIVDISSIQKAVRGFQNTNLLDVNAACDSQNDIAPYFGGTLPNDPSNPGNGFTYLKVIPAYGTAYASSGIQATNDQLTHIINPNW